MSAQGGTLGRGRAIQLPLWPVAAIVVAAIAVMIGMTVFGQAGQKLVTGVSKSEQLANSSAAVREQGGPAPVARPYDTSGLESASLWTVGQAQAYLDGLAARAAMFENSAAAIREGGTFAYHAPGRAHEVIVGIAPSTTTSIVGLENPGAYLTDDSFAPTVGPHVPIIVNGRPCPQCR
jgi:hypothetical protein